MVETESPSNTTRQASMSSQQLQIRNAVSQLFIIQDRRMTGYRELQNAFKEMLTSRDERGYRLQMIQQTAEFQACSNEVKDMIEKLSENGEHASHIFQLAEEFKQLQMLERERLRYTLILYALRKADAEQRFSWQNGIGIHPLDTGNSACGCAPEPTQEEFSGAMKEATQNLEFVTNDLNERLQELRSDFEEASALD